MGVLTVFCLGDRYGLRKTAAGNIGLKRRSGSKLKSKPAVATAQNWLNGNVVVSLSEKP